MHWYDKDGTPKHWVESKNGTKRGTTLRDARKLNLVPSVTSVLDIMAKPGLDRWKINKTIEASMSLHRGDFEDDDSLSKRILHESKRGVEEAAQRGIRIHDLLESFFKTGSIPHDKEDQAMVKSLESLIADNCGEKAWVSEETFSHRDGYGGMLDLYCLSPNLNESGWVIDFKTKEFDAGAKNLAYDSMGYQLAAYRNGMGLSKDTRIANIFISASNPGLSIFHEWLEEDAQRFEKIFGHALQLWKETKKYWPEI